MSLSFGMNSPRDLLEKVRRDLVRLETAASAQVEEQISDALFDFAVAVTSLKDWLKKQSSSAFTDQDVENHVRGSVALSSFRDIANAGKHRGITRYSPSISEVSASATAVIIPSPDPVSGARPTAPAKPTFKIKVIRRDGARLEAVQLSKQALADWETFFRTHSL